MTRGGLSNVRWVSGLKAHALDRKLVLCLLGSLHKELIEEICRDKDVTTYELVDFIEGDLVMASDLAVVRGLTPEKAGRARTSLGKLRERAVEFQDLGIGVILISSAPKEIYPEVSGSNILEDAGASPTNPIPPIISSLRESRVNSPQYCEIECEQIADGLVELGRDLVVAVDGFLFEEDGYGQSLSQHFTVAEVRSLISIGVVEQNNGEIDFTLPKRILVDCVSRAFFRFTDHPDSARQIYGDAWVIENLIRSRIRQRAMEKWGASWRDSLINQGRQRQILALAQESAYPLAKRFQDLRDPLEWLTLQELFDLRVEKGLGDLGLPGPLWSKLRSEVSPIRNKVAHMRYLSKSDAQVVRRWKSVLQNQPFE